MMLRASVLVTTALCVGLLPSCKRQDAALTYGEAQQALEEASLGTQAETLIGTSVEIATNFTIGDAVEAAAQELQEFIATQLPCAELSLADATLTIEYGVNPGTCTYHGHTFSGSHAITVTRNEPGEVQVDHEWTELSNGVVMVSGTAHVTWSLSNQSRHVIHELDWTRLRDGQSATGSGDRTQTLLAGGLAEGIRVDGSRQWESDRGSWDLAIDAVQIRWIDPVPQAGSYELTNPDGKVLTLRFERVDDDTIKVTVTNGDKSFDFQVSSLFSD